MKLVYLLVYFDKYVMISAVVPAVATPCVCLLSQCSQRLFEAIDTYAAHLVDEIRAKGGARLDVGMPVRCMLLRDAPNPALRTLISYFVSVQGSHIVLVKLRGSGTRCKAHKLADCGMDRHECLPMVQIH